MRLGRSRSAVRSLVVSALSTLVIIGAVDYAVAPPTQALAAVVKIVDSGAASSSIEGRVQGSKAGGAVTVRVEQRVGGKLVRRHVVAVAMGGRFNIPVVPGHYVVVLLHAGRFVVEWVNVTAGHSAYVLVNASNTGSAFGLAPVIFNY